jgi:SPP1 gp7 family putative phage head morphogenesis protein
MPRELSEDIKDDPARAVPLMERYQEWIEKFFLEYLEKARTAISKELDIKLNIEAGEIQTEAINEILHLVANEMLKPIGLRLPTTTIQGAYIKGIKYAILEMRRAGAPVADLNNVQILQTMMGPDLDVVGALLGRNLTNLKGITQDINDAIVRRLTAGYIQGMSIRQIADTMDEIKDLAPKRAYLIARTETMYALNQGTLNRYKSYGVKGVEWISAGEDGHTCGRCLANHGKKYKITEVPDIPLHPNCRCTTAPVLDPDFKPEPVPVTPEEVPRDEMTIVEKMNDNIRGFTAKYKDAPIEHAYVFDERGNRIWETSGSATQCNLGGAKLKDSIVIHNHPDDPTCSISPEDVAQAIKQDMKGIIAVGPDGTKMAAIRPEDGWPPVSELKFRMTQAGVMAEYRREGHIDLYETRVLEGKMTPNEANCIMTRDINERTCKNLKIPVIIRNSATEDVMEVTTA